MDTRKIVAGGMLAALTVVLSATPAGLIPVPSPAGAMTTIHIPIIIGGITLGPVVGSLLGLIFGLFTLRFGPWMIVLPPRLLIGPVAWLVWRALRRWPVVAYAAAAAAGTATNTVGVLGLAVAFGLFKLPAALSIAAINGSIEVVLAVVIVTPVSLALHRSVGLPEGPAGGELPQSGS